MIRLFKRSPLFAFRFVLWLCTGKAFLKARGAESLSDADRLFFCNTDVLHWLRLQKVSGRRLFLVKRSPIIDIPVLAGLYTIRVLAGGIAAQVEISNWLLIYSIFFFPSLAFLKRHVEVSNKAQNDKVPGRGYLLGRQTVPADRRVEQRVFGHIGLRALSDQ